MMNFIIRAILIGVIAFGGVSNVAPAETESINLEIVGTTLRYVPIEEIDNSEVAEEVTEEVEYMDELEGTDVEPEEQDNTYHSTGGSSASGSSSSNSDSGNTTANYTTNTILNQTTAQSTVTPSVAITEESTTEEELEAVWVVDVPEQVNTYPVYETVYHDVCHQCGAILDGGLASEHLATTDCSSWGSQSFQVQTGTYTEVIPEQGHWEYR